MIAVVVAALLPARRVFAAEDYTPAEVDRGTRVREHHREADNHLEGREGRLAVEVAEHVAGVVVDGSWVLEKMDHHHAMKLDHVGEGERHLALGDSSLLL